VAPNKSKSKSAISDDHLRALANGRSESAMVRRYLVALENHKPRRGRKRTQASMEKRLNVIENEVKTADALTRVQLIQERMDLQNQIDANADAIDMVSLEEDFVKAAKAYGERKGITYAAWKEFGVTPAVLKRAGIRRAG
jgi:transcription initiation factor IIF auxiliary subunit